MCANKNSGLSLLASFIVVYGPVVINSQNCAGVEPRESSGWLAGSDMLSFEIVHLSRAEILKTKQELLVGEQLVEPQHIQVTGLQLLHKPMCQIYRAVFRV